MPENDDVSHEKRLTRLKKEGLPGGKLLSQLAKAFHDNAERNILLGQEKRGEMPWEHVSYDGPL